MWRCDVPQPRHPLLCNAHHLLSFWCVGKPSDWSLMCLYALAHFVVLPDVRKHDIYARNSFWLPRTALLQVPELRDSTDQGTPRGLQST